VVGCSVKFSTHGTTLYELSCFDWLRGQTQNADYEMDWWQCSTRSEVTVARIGKRIVVKLSRMVRPLKTINIIFMKLRMIGRQRIVLKLRALCAEIGYWNIAVACSARKNKRVLSPLTYVSTEPKTSWLSIRFQLDWRAVACTNDVHGAVRRGTFDSTSTEISTPRRIPQA
jgi:hypothetical protein